MQSSFPRALIIIIIAFFGTMGLTTLLAYKRTSGNTGIDPATIQQVRKASLQAS